MTQLAILRCSTWLTVGCFAFSGFFPSNSTWGADYWVSQQAHASDDNPGSVSRPWRTLCFAAERVRPGDVVRVHSGDYRGDDVGWGKGVIPLTRSGTDAMTIRFLAAPGAKAIVKRFSLKNAAHLSIEGFILEGEAFSKLNHWHDMPHIVRDIPADASSRIDFLADWSTRQESIKSAFASYYQLTSKLEYDIGIDVENCRHVQIVGNQIDGYWAGIQCRTSSNVTIANNRISHCVNGIYTSRPTPALRNASIRNNFVTQSLDNGIDIREGSQNVVIESNQVRYSGRGHISFQDVGESSIRWNDLQYGGYYSETMQYPGSSAISVHTSREGNLVEFNRVMHQVDLTEIDGNGIIIDLMKDGARTSVRANLCWRNMGDGVNTTQSPNSIIYGNILAQNGHASQGYRRGAGVKLSRDGDLRQSIFFNVFAFNRSAGILSYRILDQQRNIDFNVYLGSDSPMIWDGYDLDERSYKTISEVQQKTGWESRCIIGLAR